MNNGYGIDRNSQIYHFRNNSGITVRGGFCEACISDRDFIDAIRYSIPVCSRGVNRNGTVIKEEVLNRFNQLGLVYTASAEELRRLIQPNFSPVAPCEDIPDIPTLWSKAAPIYLYDEWCEEQDMKNVHSEELDSFLRGFVKEAM